MQCSAQYSTVHYNTVKYSTVRYSTLQHYLDGKGSCDGKIGAVIYINKAKAIRDSDYTSFNTLKIITWVLDSLVVKALAPCHRGCRFDSPPNQVIF